MERPNYKGRKFAGDDGCGRKRSKSFHGISLAMATQWVKAIAYGYEDEGERMLF